MELYILSKQDLSILSICKLADYQINLDEETNAKSTFTLMKTNGLKKENYMVLNGLYRQFIFVIDDVQTEKESDVVTVTALDISNVFNRKVIEKNIDTMKSKSIEEFLANTISENFVNSDDTALNVNYIEIYWHTNTQGNVATNAENGLYNFHTFLINCRQYKNIYTDFKLENLGNPQTVEGKRISVEARNRKIVDISLHGESTQKTSTQSSNLFDEEYYNNDDIYTSATYKYVKARFTGNRTLYFKATLKEGKTAQTGAYIAISESNGSPYVTGTKSAYAISNGSAITSSKDFSEITDIYVNIYPNTLECATIFDNYNLWVSTDNVSYEKFIPDSPSPDYPSPIENVEGKNLFDGNKSEWGKYNVWQHNTGNYANAFVNVINIKGLNKCSISFKNNTRTFRFGYQFIDDNENYLSGVYWSASTNEKVFANISVPENASKIIISQLDGQKEDDIEIQLEEGTVATPYVPYNSLEFKDIGENLFNISKVQNVNDDVSNCTLIEKNANGVKIQGATSTATDIFAWSKGWYCPGYSEASKEAQVSIKEPCTIKLSADVTLLETVTEPRIRMNLRKVNGDAILADSIVLNLNKKTRIETTFKVTSGKFSPFFALCSNTFLIENIMISTTGGEYKPYQEQKVDFPLSEGQKLYEGSYLASDGIHHKRRQIVLNGTESITNVYVNTSTTRFGFSLNLTPDKKIGLDNVLSTHFKCDTTIYYDSQTQVGICGNARNVNIYIRVNGNVTTDEFKTWLATQYANGTPVIVEYELAEPEVVPYTEEQQEAWNKIKNLTLFEGVNHISSDANMVLKYYPLEPVGLKFVLRIDIENKQETTELIDTTLPEVADYNKIYEEDVTAKVQVYIREDGSEYNLYLKTDRTTTSNKDDPDRASGKIEVISVETADKAPEEALNVMKGNNYKHLVEFKIAKTSKLMDITQLYIGRPIRIKTEDDIYDSYISALTLSDENFVYFKSGSLRITLLDKLKKSNDSAGNKLDVSGGKITGNLNINGILKNNNKTILDLTYPIGSIYLSIKNTNPSSLFGGIWEAWGSGRVPVGVDTTQTEFETVEKTGGEKTHTLTVDEMPSHNHNVKYNTESGIATASVLGTDRTASDTEGSSGGGDWYVWTTGAGGDEAHNNLQPYITCYMFKRVG